MNINELQNKVKWVRRITLEMINKAGSGHPGGSLSEAEILTVLYYNVLNIDPRRPDWPDRDRFILSKGHCCPPVYAILADLGYFPKEELNTLRKYKSILQGHPSIITPGIDMVSGSLGNGLSVGVGMAMAGRKQKRNYNVYVMMGDGELQEGTIWEAAMSAAHHKLNRLIGIVDYNKIQINGNVSDIMAIEPLADKWKSFGWKVIEINGHDLNEICDTFRSEKYDSVRPTVIIAHTVKGSGVSFMEGNCAWHGKAPDEEQLKIALNEIGGTGI